MGVPVSMPVQSSEDTATLDALAQRASHGGAIGAGASPKLMSLPQLLMLAVGIIGFQFAWSTQIALSSRVLEPLGADPFLFGLIWCAGPITGMVVAPLVGMWSDHTLTPLGKRWPYVLAGAVLGAIAMVLFPQSPNLWVAAIMIWLIDAFINTAQGPYRALVPDMVPRAQQSIANSYLNFGVGTGNVIAMGFAPLALAMLGQEIPIQSQYVISAVVLAGITILTALFVKEKPASAQASVDTIGAEPAPAITAGIDADKAIGKATPGVAQMFKNFAAASPEIHKISAVQFFTWVALMGMFIYLTPYVTHHVFKVPDLTRPELFSAAQMAGFKTLEKTATNTTQQAFAAFNLVCLLLSLPLGYLTTKFGKKPVLSFALLTMAAGFLTAPFISTPLQVIAMLACAGVAWATTLSIPFSILCDHMPKGQEGSIMGMFNVFVAAPQLISAIAVGWVINQMPVALPVGYTHAWWLPFTVGTVSLIIAVGVLQTIKEHKPLRA
ncbi:MAG: MFS transporter [Vampirovibrionales bacterium]|nr:MFS transporter [Vampirovibrionales bacterium]